MLCVTGLLLTFHFKCLPNGTRKLYTSVYRNGSTMMYMKFIFFLEEKLFRNDKHIVFITYQLVGCEFENFKLFVNMILLADILF